MNYFSTEQGAVVSTFLSLVAIKAGEAGSLSTAMCEELKRWKLNIANLIAIGIDNANVMVGSGRSVYTELKKHAPSLILIKCVCHSVQLAVSYACVQYMPDNLKFLIYKTYNWFAKTSIPYKRIYQCINNDKV